MKRRPPSQEAMERYIAEIDRFAIMLRDQQEEIVKLAHWAHQAKEAYEAAKEAVREAKEQEHNTVSLLLKFVRPGSIEVMPLFDKMEPADEKVHGKDSTAWRQEPISALGLSALAMRALLDADVVLVGQLQDRILKGPTWAQDLNISDGIAQAIEAKLHQFVEERTSR
jgi:rhamnose utilization protein RhaD (predicted bifunctional aldolase and dehydrogenase)